MATGIPVVASNVGGIPEELVYGGGMLVPPSDPEALADALQELVQDEPKRQAMGEAAKSAFREHFLWSNARQQYEDAIHDVMSGSSAEAEA